MSIQIVCAWCGKHLGTKPGDAALPVSHSICSDCAGKLREQIQETPVTKGKEVPDDRQGN